jgi:hypothetical protein
LDRLNEDPHEGKNHVKHHKDWSPETIPGESARGPGRSWEVSWLLGRHNFGSLLGDFGLYSSTLLFIGGEEAS